MKKDSKLHLFYRVCWFLCKIKRSIFIHKIPDFQGPGASTSHTSFILTLIYKFNKSCVVSQEANIFIHILTPDPDPARPLHHTDGQCSVLWDETVDLCWSNADNHPTKEWTALSQVLVLLICFLTFHWAASTWPISLLPLIVRCLLLPPYFLPSFLLSKVPEYGWQGTHTELVTYPHLSPLCPPLSYILI